MIRVILCDDHALIRRGIRDTLSDAPDIEVVGEAANGAEAVRLAAETVPDVVVLDYGMPLMNGLTAAREIMAEAPRPRDRELRRHARVVHFSSHPARIARRNIRGN